MGRVVDALSRQAFVQKIALGVITPVRSAHSGIRVTEIASGTIWRLTVIGGAAAQKGVFYTEACSSQRIHQALMPLGVELVLRPLDDSPHSTV
jgi:hypothetical protein